MKLTSSLLFLGIAGLLSAEKAFSQTTFWQNPGLEFWINGANWSAGVPNQNLDARIDNGGNVLLMSGATGQARTVAVAQGPFSAGSLTIINIGEPGTLNSGSAVIGGQGSGAATVYGPGSSWTNNGQLEIGREGTGTLNVNNGGAVSNTSAIIGTFAGADGTVWVDGIGSRWTNSLGIYAGYSGSGKVNIQNGGAVTSSSSYIGFAAGSNGAVAVDGVSSWQTVDVEIGTAGTGTLSITNGSKLDIGNGYVGIHAGSNGSVTVSGDGSEWLNRFSLAVGVLGVGKLAVQDGGAVGSEGGVRIGDGLGSNGLIYVTGAGSTFTVFDDASFPIFLVGNAGLGALIIQAGGSVDSASIASIGKESTSTGTVVVKGNGSTWTHDGFVIVGSSGTGTLTIQDGAVVSADGANLGEATGSSGTISVAGSGSKWTNSGTSTRELHIGNGGAGTVNIADGGAVSSRLGKLALMPNSSGTVTISGSGSTWSNAGDLIVGEQGNGTLNVQNGGSVSLIGDHTNMHIGQTGVGSVNIWGGGSLFSHSITIGTNAGSNGTARVTGTGTTWTNVGQLSVGKSGVGALTIEAGATLVSNTGAKEIGHNYGSTGVVTVTGPGSTWTSNQSLEVGVVGAGTLIIENGGSVSGTSGVIGDASGSVGSATVRGAGSTWTMSSSLSIASGGFATLSVENGGSVSSTAGSLGLATGAEGSAIVTGSGSTWTMTQQLSIGGNFPTGTNGGIGTLTVDTGGSVSAAQDTTLFPGARLRLRGGTLTTSAITFQGVGGQFLWTSGTLHVGTYNGDLTNPNGGILAPGNSSGSTQVVGNYTQQAGAILDIEIGGTLVNSQYDSVNITGTALLSGQLNLALINGFVPTPQQTFIIFNAASILSSFSNVTDGQRLTTIDGTGSFLVNYGPTSILNPNQIRLTDFQLAGIPGDYNQNGVVDAADYARWRDNLGSGTSLPNDDTPGVGPDDYSRWRSHFGQTAGSGSFSDATIPEPSSASLFVPIALAAIRSWRRWRRECHQLVTA
jgi:T5SS/PEP-CTERM-associated repeat protein